MRPINFTKKLTTSICLAILMLSMQGCVEDDLSVCGVSLKFTYTQNLEDVDKFAEEVNRVDVFVFDSNHIFVGRFTEGSSRLHGSSYSMPLNLMEETYTFAVWGNLCDDYVLTDLVAGETSLEEAMLSLNRESDIIEWHPGSLYFGSRTEDVHPAEQSNQLITIDMMRDTKNIRVITKGLPLEDPAVSDNKEYTCTISSRNGDYKFDNSITGSSRLQYIPVSYVDTTANTSLVSDFVTLRELNDASTGSRLQLEYDSEETGQYRQLFDADLVRDLLLPASISTNLDIEHDFTIELEVDFTMGSVTVTIGEWTKVFNDIVVGYQ